MLFQPCLKTPLSSQAVPIFYETIDRLASAYMADPTEEHLWDILSLPKRGLAPEDMYTRFRSFKTRMQKYPHVPYINTNTHKAVDATKAVKLQTAINQGRITTAGRILMENKSLAPQTDETIDELKRLHPQGPTNPFTNFDGPNCRLKVGLGDITDAFAGIRPDVAGGVCGWTHNMFKTAFRLQSSFAEFYQPLPCKSILTGAPLTPLDKNPGVRPIAVDELLYRIAAKTILRTSFHADMLLPSQFGVMSPGGVEPIIRLWQSAQDGKLPDSYVYGTQLDSINAFNTLDRNGMATSIRRYAPELFRVAKWAYKSPADILVRMNGTTVKLQSTQGVRQGDPFGPLFYFSRWVSAPNLKVYKPT